MPRARKHLVSVDDTPYYLVTSRCVRRAFLCGVDKHSGKSFEHRRGWLEDRVRILASLFSIELCAYAIMSNHYHLVVRLIPNEASAWSDSEVLDRWTALYRGPLLVQKSRDGKPLSLAELATLRSVTAIYRQRLSSLSWFMKCLNEPIARRANHEDDCTGHFWESRFHSQALRSEKALFTAMTYVDLNPVRAGLAKTPELSMYTSLRARVMRGNTNSQLTSAAAKAVEHGELRHIRQPLRPLAAFSDCGIRTETTLPIRETDYLNLVDLTGRSSLYGKPGRIEPDLLPILDRLELSADQWVAASSAFKKHYRAGDLKKSE